MHSVPLLERPIPADALAYQQVSTVEPGSLPLCIPGKLHQQRHHRNQPLQLHVHAHQTTLHSAPAQQLVTPTWLSSADTLCELVQPQSLQLDVPHEPDWLLSATSPFAPELFQQLQALEDSFACSSPTGPSEEQRKRNNNFQINFGRAIRALREDIPAFFKREGDMTIYADDMHFQDNISARLWSRIFDIRGISQYKGHCQRMRMVFKFFFKQSDVQVWRFWPKDKYITIARWSVKSYPRLLSSQCVQIDGISEFRFNEEGQIQEHILDVIDWNGLRAMLEKRKEKAALAGLVPNSCSGMLPPDGSF